MFIKFESSSSLFATQLKFAFRFSGNICIWFLRLFRNRRQSSSFTWFGWLEDGDEITLLSLFSLEKFGNWEEWLAFLLMSLSLKPTHTWFLFGFSWSVEKFFKIICSTESFCLFCTPLNCSRNLESQLQSSEPSNRLEWNTRTTSRQMPLNQKYYTLEKRKTNTPMFGVR